MSALEVIGTSVKRVEGRPKVTGQARFSDDLRLHDLLYARLVLSPYAHARIVRIDASAALDLPGVEGVLRGEEVHLPGLRQASRSKNPIARGEVFFRGQPVAIVLAESDSIAEDAAALVQVEYEELPIVPDAQAALSEDAEPVRPLPQEREAGDAAAHAAVSVADEPQESRGPNISNSVHFNRGDVAQGFAEADVVLERTYHTSTVHQSYMEPRAVTANSEPGSGEVTVWTSTQGIFYCRSDVAQTVGLDERQVTIVPMEVGGGFGAKICVMEPLVAALALQLERPVRLVFNRSDEFLNATAAPPSTIQVKLGTRRDGTFTALQASLTFDTGAFPGTPMPIASLLIGSFYTFPNLEIHGQEVLSHTPGPGSYRAPGAVQATFAIESTVDQVARALQIDPIELRLKNCVDPGGLLASGERWASVGARTLLERLRDLPVARQREKGPDEGIGIAMGGWPGGVEPASATCRMDRDGGVTVSVGAVDISGTSTTMAMIASQALGIPLEKIKLVHDDTASAPYSPMAGGSKTIYTVGDAVLRAAEHAREQLLRIAADTLEVSVEDLELVDGQVQVRGTDRAASVADIAAATQSFGGKYEPIFGRGSVANTERAPGFSVHLARVHVDRDTGQVTVKEYIALQDVGRALNPAGVTGQVQGGVTQGIGWALYEEIVHDDQGQLLTGTLADYAIPRAEYVPPITSILVENPSPRGPHGARGVGEPPVIPGAAVIANAVEDAIGVRILDIPITPEKVLHALGALPDPNRA